MPNWDFWFKREFEMVHFDINDAKVILKLLYKVAC